MIFEDILNKLVNKRPSELEEPSHWVTCKKCKAVMYYKEVALKKYVCPKCDLHMRIKATDRINLIADRDTFEEKDDNLRPTDPLNFKDQKTYKKMRKNTFNNHYKKICRRNFKFIIRKMI